MKLPLTNDIKFLIAMVIPFSLSIQKSYSQKLLFTQPEKLPKSINGSTDVDFPMFAPDGSFLFFSRSGDARNSGGAEAGSDIWFTEYDSVKNTWSEAKNDLGVLNNENENAVVGIRADAKRIYLYNSYLQANPGRVSLCYSDYIDGSWSTPALLNIGKIEVGLDPYGLFMNKDENVLFISMNGEYGNEDIYVSFKNDKGKWSKLFSPNWRKK